MPLTVNEVVCQVHIAAHREDVLSIGRSENETGRVAHPVETNIRTTGSQRIPNCHLIEAPHQQVSADVSKTADVGIQLQFKDYVSGAATDHQQLQGSGLTGIQLRSCFPVASSINSASCSATVVRTPVF